MNHPEQDTSLMAGVTVNGQLHQVPTGISLATLIAMLGHAPQTVATAVDGGFVARDARETFALHPGAKVTCFQPIVGG